jgi:hypothetical protein
MGTLSRPPSVMRTYTARDLDGHPCSSRRLPQSADRIEQMSTDIDRAQVERAGRPTLRTATSFIDPFRQACETHRERTGIVPT